MSQSFCAASLCLNHVSIELALCTAVLLRAPQVLLDRARQMLTEGRCSDREMHQLMISQLQVWQLGVCASARTSLASNSGACAHNRP